MGRTGAVVISVVMGAALVACDAAAEPEGGWRQADELIETSGLVWASEGVVHLGEDRSIDVGEEIDQFFVAGDGVFYVPADADGARDELWFLRPGSEPEPTGLRALSRHLVVSPDGRFVAELVPPGSGNDPQLRMFDLVEGTATTTSEHLELDRWDPEDDWEESGTHLLGIADGEVFLSGGADLWAYDVTTGESRDVGEDEPLPGPGNLVDNPSRTWRFDWDQQPATRVRSRADDTRVALRHDGHPVVLSGWVDDDTVHGVPLNSPDEPVLVVCHVPAGDCEAVKGTAGAELVVLELDAPAGAVDLAAVRAEKGQ